MLWSRAANHGTVSTTALLECTANHLQGLDTGPAINQAHSSPSHSPYFGPVESSPVVVHAGNSPSPYESSSAVNQIEILHTLDVAVTEISPEINEAGESSHVTIAEINQEINKVGNSFDVTVTAAEESSPAAELVEVFRFPDLAPEIRNRIYRFVLGPPEDPSICLTQILDNRPLRAQSGGVDLDNTFRTNSVVPNPKHKDPNWGVTHQVDPQNLSILLVSKQIYVEAFHVFYSTNCLSFTDTGLLFRFLKNIGSIRRQHLTMIYFLWRGPDAKEAFRLLKTCRRLKIVQFTVPCSHPPGYEALKEVRVEEAKARALVHFTPAQNPPLNIHDHTSCFGDYLCHCLCRRHYEPSSNLRELEKAMMRPRCEQDIADTEEKFDLFKLKRERFKMSEEQDLLKEKASFDDFIGRIEQQGKELKYLGRRNKNKEAALNQTLNGPAVDEYFRDFADKLAKDKRQLKRKERWDAKLLEEKEAKERAERYKREAIEEKELGIKMRKEARELKWKIARETRENNQKVAKEARELKRMINREAKEREKIVAAELKAEKGAARELKRRNKKTIKGTKKLGKRMVSALD